MNRHYYLTIFPFRIKRKTVTMRSSRLCQSISCLIYIAVYFISIIHITTFIPAPLHGIIRRSTQNIEMAIAIEICCHVISGSHCLIRHNQLVCGSIKHGIRSRSSAVIATVIATVIGGERRRRNSNYRRGQQRRREHRHFYHHNHRRRRHHNHGEDGRGGSIYSSS